MASLTLDKVVCVTIVLVTLRLGNVSTFTVVAIEMKARDPRESVPHARPPSLTDLILFMLRHPFLP
jgi:hypothetical protein